MKNKNINLKNGTIMKVQNKLAEVITDEHEVAACSLPKTVLADRNAVIVGDKITMEQIGEEQYRLKEVLPRASLLCRGNRRSVGEQVPIAANADYMLAVVTAEYLVNQCGYWEQAIIAAYRAEIEIGLVISKWDLVNETIRDAIKSKLVDYQRTVKDVFFSESTKLTEELRNVINKKTTVVVGDRGCGKTALIANICGKHLSRYASTNQAELIYNDTNTTLMSETTLMIDTPGFKEFAIEDISEDELAFVFPEITERAEKCTFRNCTHTHEDGCQVIEGVRSGVIRRERYQTYQQMNGNPASIAKKKKDREIDYRHEACMESFECQVCGKMIVPEGAGSSHRNHCPYCLSSIHVDESPGDRASLCKGIMDPVGIWVRKGGEWAIIHRCRDCGTFSSNRIAADDNPMKLMSIAVKPLSNPPFPLELLGDGNDDKI